MDNDDDHDGVGLGGGTWIGSKRGRVEIVEIAGRGVQVLRRVPTCL